MRMGYHLLEVPNGYKTELALIIAPYFDLAFTKQLVRRLKPRKIRFVVDDGARAEDVLQLSKSFRNIDVKVALGAATGIVHVKAFFIDFVKITGRRQRRRYFIFGSANATEAGF